MALPSFLVDDRLTGRPGRPNPPRREAGGSTNDSLSSCGESCATVSLSRQFDSTGALDALHNWLETELQELLRTSNTPRPLDLFCFWARHASRDALEVSCIHLYNTILHTVETVAELVRAHKGSPLDAAGVGWSVSVSPLDIGGTTRSLPPRMPPLDAHTADDDQLVPQELGATVPAEVSPSNVALVDAHERIAAATPPPETHDRPGTAAPPSDAATPLAVDATQPQLPMAVEEKGEGRAAIVTHAATSLESKTGPSGGVMGPAEGTAPPPLGVAATPPPAQRAAFRSPACRSPSPTNKQAALSEPTKVAATHAVPSEPPRDEPQWVETKDYVVVRRTSLKPSSVPPLAPVLLAGPALPALHPAPNDPSQKATAPTYRSIRRPTLPAPDVPPPRRPAPAEHSIPTPMVPSPPLARKRSPPRALSPIIKSHERPHPPSLSVAGAHTSPPSHQIVAHSLPPLVALSSEGSKVADDTASGLRPNAPVAAHAPQQQQHHPSSSDVDLHRSGTLLPSAAARRPPLLRPSSSDRCGDDNSSDDVALDPLDPATTAATAIDEVAAVVNHNTSNNGAAAVAHNNNNIATTAATVPSGNTVETSDPAPPIIDREAALETTSPSSSGLIPIERCRDASAAVPQAAAAAGTTSSLHSAVGGGGGGANNNNDGSASDQGSQGSTGGTTERRDAARGALIYRALEQTHSNDALYLSRTSPPPAEAAKYRFRQSNNAALQRFFEGNATVTAHGTTKVVNVLPLRGNAVATSWEQRRPRQHDDSATAVYERNATNDVAAVGGDVARPTALLNAEESAQREGPCIPVEELPRVLVYNTSLASIPGSPPTADRGAAQATGPATQSAAVDEEKLYEAETASDFERIGPWVIVDCLGHGQQGEVHLAVHENTGECAAIKKIHHDKRAGLHARVEREQLNRELSMSLSFDHPNIVKALELIKPRRAETIFLVMQLAPGGSLAKVADDGTCKTFPLAMLHRFALQATSALRYLHSMKVVHRDIKPDNFLLDTDGNVLLSDFGVCIVNSPAFRAKAAAGFVAQGAMSYRAPEEFVETFKAVGPGIDMWSLGVSLYAMTFGALPFRAETYDALRSAICTQEPSYQFTPVGARERLSSGERLADATYQRQLQWWIDCVLKKLLQKKRHERMRSRTLLEALAASPMTTLST